MYKITNQPQFKIVVMLNGHTMAVEDKLNGYFLSDILRILFDSSFLLLSLANQLFLYRSVYLVFLVMIFNVATSLNTNISNFFAGDCGDHVVVINTKHIAFSGNKWEQKVYSSHTG